MSPVRAGLVAGAAVLPAAAGVAGCGLAYPGRQSMTVDADPMLNQQLRELGQSHQSVPLRMVTGFAWDRVHLSYEGTPAGQIGDQVATTVHTPGSHLFAFSDALAVLTLTGEVVVLLPVPELVFTVAGFGYVTTGGRRHR